jgi:hypothetical protein
MRVYVDTGTFIDYLAQAAPAAAILRSAHRRGRTKGRPHAILTRVTAARPIVAQALIAARLFGLQILEIDERTIDSLAGHTILLAKAIRAADGLHIIRAIDFDADLVLATDARLLALDQILVNQRGTPIRCCDTDLALTLL